MLDVGLERNGPDKIAVAKVVAAWEAAQTRTRALQTQAAEERSAGLPASITSGAFIAARWAWEENPAANLAMGQSLGASEPSAKSYVEWRFAQVDDGEFLAKSLAEVVSQQEESQQVDDTTQAHFVQQGNKAVVRLRRARAGSAMPATAVEAQTSVDGSPLEHGLCKISQQIVGGQVQSSNISTPSGLALGRKRSRPQGSQPTGTRVVQIYVAGRASLRA